MNAQAQANGNTSSAPITKGSNATRGITIKVDDEGFAHVPSERYSYKPEECGKALLQGYIVGHKTAIGANGKELDVLALFTTKETTACDISGEPCKVKPGSIVEFIAGHYLQHLVPLAFGSMLSEVKIKPKAKVGLSKGRTAWTFEVAAVHPIQVPRPGYFPTPPRPAMGRAEEENFGALPPAYDPETGEVRG